MLLLIKKNSLIVYLLLFICMFAPAKTHANSQKPQAVNSAYSLGIIADSEVNNLSNTIIDSISLLNSEAFQKKYGLDKPIIFANEMLPSFMLDRTQTLDIIAQSEELQKNTDIDLILVVGINASRLVLKENKGNKPIFLISEHDLVENNIIHSYEDSGYDNVTAFIKQIDLIARLSQLTKLLNYQKFGIITFENENSSANLFAKRFQERIKSTDLTLQEFTIKEDTEEDITAILPHIIEAKPDILIIKGIQNFERNHNAWDFIEPLIDADIPCLSPDLRSMVSKGALIGFSMNEKFKSNIFADTMAKLLKGEKPRDINMVHPYYAELNLNMLIANELELFLSYEILASCHQFFYSIDTGTKLNALYNFKIFIK